MFLIMPLLMPLFLNLKATALLEDALKYAQAQGRAASGKVFEYRGVLIDAN